MSAITAETLTIFLIVLQENRAAEWRESGISIDLIACLLGHKKQRYGTKIYHTSVFTHSICAAI